MKGSLLGSERSTRNSRLSTLRWSVSRHEPTNHRDPHPAGRIRSPAPSRPYPSHHNPARAWESPAGGSGVLGDLRKSSKVMFCFSSTLLLFRSLIKKL